jgi:hypothetical protein
MNLDSQTWTPIGASGSPFSGILDGNGKTITNLNVNKTAGNAGCSA